MIRKLLHKYKTACWLAMLLVSAGFILSVLLAGKAYACGNCYNAVSGKEDEEWGDINDIPAVNDDAATAPRIKTHQITERTAMQSWIVQIFWEDNILPAMMLMTNQMTAVAMKQAEMLGMFMDAKHQLETQQVFQKLASRSHKDYMPSTGVCEFGSTARSLAASERKGELTAIVLAKRSQNRNLGNQNTAAAIGEDSDKKSRLKQFREKFCDPFDNNNGLSYLCEHGNPPDHDLTDNTMGDEPPNGIGAPQGPDPNAPNGPLRPMERDYRMNKDIDYTRTMDYPWTLDMDMVSTDADPDTGDTPATTLTGDEEDVMALANNLYAQEIFFRPPSLSLELNPDGNYKIMQKNYMDLRSIVAKRSVAENSFNAIAAMKTAGTPGSRDYLVAILEQFLPVPDPDSPTNGTREAMLNDLKRMLGRNPSYYAQMEILTKKIFQNPDFYTNLYDTPANVSRKGVAIQAIALMQKFDLYKSYLRNEASLSVLLELAVQDLQDETENEFNAIGTGGVGNTDEDSSN